jgi:hypothetical protein
MTTNGKVRSFIKIVQKSLISGNGDLETNNLLWEEVYHV